MPLPRDEEVLEELRALHCDPQPLMLRMTKLQGFLLMQQLQLALIHPQNRGDAADQARLVAESIEREVCTTPALHAIARAGWENRG